MICPDIHFECFSIKYHSHFAISQNDCVHFENMKSLILLYIFVIIPVVALSNTANDSVKSRRSLYVLPVASYQPETGIAGGVGFGYYPKTKDKQRVSSYTGNAVYTLHHQFIVNFTPKVYFADNKWYLYARLNIREYPDFYYGIGNYNPWIKTAYTSRNTSITIQPQYLVAKNYFLGIHLSYRYEKVTNLPEQDKLNQIFTNFGKEGWSPYQHLAFGIVSTYDSRNNLFYSEKGTFLKMAFSVAPSINKNFFPTREASIDYRTFIPVFNKSTLAFQIYNSAVFGEKNVPFQLLPKLGGQDIMRGFVSGVYRDNWLFALQSEMRIPVYKRIKAAIFCATGDVLNFENPEVKRLKFGYGAGLRYRLNGAKVHLRLDVARNNYDNKFHYYITASEAF